MAEVPLSPRPPRTLRQAATAPEPPPPPPTPAWDADLRAACAGVELTLVGLGDQPCYELPAAALAEVAGWLRARGYDYLRLVSTVDRGTEFELVYLLGGLSAAVDPAWVALRCRVPREAPAVPTLTGLWRGADWLEREQHDLMGIDYEGHPDPRRILLPDCWVGHPLRKDYIWDSDTMVSEVLAAELVSDEPSESLDLSSDEDGLRTEDLALNMGPQHPSTHGVLRLRLAVDGEYVRSCDPDLGFLHRSFEKLGELKTYVNGVTLTDRWDYLNAMGNNLVHCQTVETALGLELPERVHWIRMLVLELNRLASHLIFFGTYGLDVGAQTPFLYCFRDRERILDMFELLCGARLTYHYLRIGGVAAELPRNFLSDYVRPFLGYLQNQLDEHDALLSGNSIFLERTVGVSIWSPELCIDYGVTGPCLRASGVAYDVRRALPYARYDQVEFDIPIGQNGDSFDRYAVRLAEARQSLRILEQVCDWLEANDAETRGQIQAKTPRAIKVPEGEWYTCVETPRGELGLHLVGDGTERPWRYKIRRPSYSNLAVMPEVGRDLKVADLIAVLGTTDVVMGEVDG